MSKNVSTTAATVRAYFREDATRLPEGFTAENSNLAEGARGRLNPALIAAFNAAHPRAKYVTGAVATVAVKVEVGRTAKGRKSFQTIHETLPTLRQAARDAGVEVASKGKMTDAQMQAAGLHLIQAQA